LEAPGEAVSKKGDTSRRRKAKNPLSAKLSREKVENKWMEKRTQKQRWDIKYIYERENRGREDPDFRSPNLRNPREKGKYIAGNDTERIRPSRQSPHKGKHRGEGSQTA